MIYFYYIIIVYRNRFSLDIRKKLIDIDKIEFQPLHKIIENKALLFLLKVNKFFLKHKVYYLILGLSFVGLIYYVFPGYLKADISSGLSTQDIQNTLINTVMLDPSQDFFNEMLGGKGGDISYLLTFFSVILFLQVFKDVIKNTIITEYLENIIGIFKKIFHIIFYIYNKFIVFFTTRFILYIITFVLKFNINITGLFLLFFSLFYLLVYVFIIAIYYWTFVYVFHISFLAQYGWQFIFIISVILIGMNLISDYKNFENFLIGINDFMNSTKEKLGK